MSPCFYNVLITGAIPKMLKLQNFSEINCFRFLNVLRYDISDFWDYPFLHYKKQIYESLFNIRGPLQNINIHNKPSIW
jgi:hypothetical protein